MRSLAIALVVGILLLLGGCWAPRCVLPAPVENPVAPGVLTRDGCRYCFAWTEIGSDRVVYQHHGCADTATDALMLGDVLRMRLPEIRPLPPSSMPVGVPAPAEAAHGLNAILSRPKPLACGAGKCG